MVVIYLVQKICKYCGGIIENAKPNQFYHKKEDDSECYNKRMRELSKKSSKNHRMGRINKVCLYCGEIIKNASRGQLYHTEKQNKECYTNRNLEKNQNWVAEFRKQWKGDQKINKRLGTGWLSKHPHKIEETDIIDFESEYSAIQKEKRRLRI